MAGETAWLDGDPLWLDGHVVWRTDQGLVSPTPADLALAQRRLNQIGAHPTSAKRAFGDAGAWLSRRQGRLGEAKLLQPLVMQDLPALVAQARSGYDDAAGALARLLTAEALCLNDLPLRPSTALVDGGEGMVRPVRDALRDPDLPVVSRALAALVLGALHRLTDTVDAALPPLSPQVRRSYRWGRTSGLPAYPALLVALLADPRGVALAARYQRTRDAGNPFALGPSAVRRLVARSTPVSRSVAVAEAVAAAAPLADHLLSYRAQLPTREDARRAAAETLAQERREALVTLRDILHGYALQSGDPALVRTVVLFMETMVHLGPIRRELTDALAIVLRQTLSLPHTLQRPWLDLLIAEQARIWPADAYAGALGGKALQPWLENQQKNCVWPLRTVLQRTQSSAVVRAAFDLDIHRTLALHDWDDPARYRLVVDLVQRYGTNACWRLCRFLDLVSSARQARDILAPLTRALAEVPQAAGGLVFEAAMDLLWDRGVREVRDNVRRFSQYVDRLVAFVEAQDAEPSLTVPVDEIAILDREAPHQAHAWIDWLLAFLASSRKGQPPSYRPGPTTEQAVRLAIVVADGDTSVFQRVVRAALSHDFDYAWDIFEQSIAALRHSPRFIMPLAHLFDRQPHRCMKVVVNAGLATRLGADATERLRQVPHDGPVDSATRAPGWAEVLAHAPAAAPWATYYLVARDQCGEDRAVPPAVRKALDQPRRWAAEMRHLEQLVAADPARRDLQTRLANLWARRADATQVEKAIQEEIVDHLRQLAADAQMIAAERVIQSCYRFYLDRIAGPLPADLAITDDLLNAALLSVDIKRNRRLLLRLLRAYLAGDHHWPEKHPANRRFLAGLAEAGIDTEVWLGARPRVYRSAAVPGDRLHLFLERDPLRVLQMGNLFDTCLSFGGINAFSTVANACEVNKRVLYIRDGKGRIVGRKLIALSEAGTLVGFRTYGGLHDEAGNAALKRVVRAYCARFARDCRVTLADVGTVPRLFVKDWYDDGVVAWNDDVATLSSRHAAMDVGVERAKLRPGAK